MFLSGTLSKPRGKKDESAFQYHFLTIRVLIASIGLARDEGIHTKRGVLLDEFPHKSAEPALRDLRCLLALPTFILAKNSGFRCYVIGFSHELAMTNKSAFNLASQADGTGFP